MNTTRKLNEQHISEAASEDSINAVKNTPPKPGRNGDYSPDLAKALRFYIEQNIFDMRDITMEPAFCDIFLNKAPPSSWPWSEKQLGSIPWVYL